MYILPQNTLLSKQIPKKAIFEKFSLSSAQRQHLDADIARIDIVAQLSPQTFPAISKGTEVDRIYVMHVSLKTKGYSKESILFLARLIPQRMLFALCHESEVQQAIAHQGFHTGSWSPQDEVQIQNKQEQERLLREIAQLKAKMNRDRALSKQMQICSQINQLRKRLQ